MSDLAKVKEWLKTFPEYDILSQFKVDYTDQIPSNGGIFPAGMMEISRTENILGDVTVQNQYNFGLYYVFAKSPGDDVGAQMNADWVMDFQRWVQEQSIKGLAPHFGNTDAKESAKAENGVLYAAENEGVATYMVQLSFTFTNKYEVI